MFTTTRNVCTRTGSLVLLLGCLLPGTGALALSNPNDFCTGDPCIISSPKTADAGITLDFGTRAVRLTEILTIANLPSGNVGSLTILAGSFTILGNGQIKGTNGTHQAGSATIVTTGDIRLDGTRSTGAIRLVGADGGNLDLNAGGSIFASGKINLDHDGLPAGGGSLLITSGGVVDISGDIIAEGGVQGFGGSVDIQGGGDIDISGLIDISGGESGGGFLDIFGFTSITLGVLDIHAGGDIGDAGLADITAIGDISLTGMLNGDGADNGENCGDAGDVDVTADGDITVSAPIDMKGSGLDCAGGFLALDGNNVTITAQLDLSGTGIEGVGGDIDIAASSAMLITQDIVLDGGDGAGDLLVAADGDLTMLGDIVANGRNSFGAGSSLLELESSGTLYVDSHIDARGGSLGAGGDVSLDGCSVVTSAATLIQTTATAGLITVMGYESIVLDGTFVGEPTSPSGILIRFGPLAAPPNIAAATFNYPPTLQLNLLALPCNLCSTNAECDDTNACTNDVCIPSTGCVNSPNSLPCSDGSLCTVGDICSGGSCTGGPPASCVDGNVCTDDLCLPLSGCQNPPNSAPCNDGNLCTTGDVCSASSCNGIPINCEDGNPCTTNSCAAGVCQSANNTLPCNDGEVCTDGDVCSGGSCAAGPPLNCVDSDPCTTDLCITGSGCQNDPIPACGDADNDGIPDNADPCTTLDWTTVPLAPPNQHTGIMRLNLSGLATAGEQKMLLKGFFNVAAPVQPVAPQSNGVHLVLGDANGVVYELSVPGGAVGAPQQCGSNDGWSVVSGGGKTKWKYVNKSNALPPACVAGSARGLYSIQIKDLRSVGKAALQAKLKAKRATFDRALATPRTELRADLALAAQPAPGVASQQAIDGQCAEGLITGSPIAAAAPAPYCKAKLAGAVLDKLACKGP